MHKNLYQLITGRQCCGLVLIVFVVLFSAPWSHARTLLIKGDHKYPPYEYLNGNNAPEGFNIDITRAVAREMGMDIRIELGPWDQVRAELETGRIDALMGMFNTPDRDRQVDFSIPHFIASYAVFIRTGTAVKSIEDAKGKTIIVQKGDLGHDWVAGRGLAGKLLTQTNIDEALELLASGRGDCAVVSRLQGLIIIKKKNITNIEAVGPPIIQRKYCLAVTEGNSGLLAKLNEGLSILKTSGEYDRIHEKWFGVYEPGGMGFKKFLHIFILVAVALAVAVLLFAAWSWSLRKQVAARTRELQYALERIDNIIRSMPSILVCIDHDGRIILWNDKASQYTGLSRDQALYQPMAEVFPEFKKSLEQLTTDIRSQPFASESCTIQKENGIDLNFDITMYPLESGLESAVVRIDDITEQVRMKNLLVQSQKMESIGTLAGGIAHDFNNILSAIMGYAELSKMKLPPDHQVGSHLDKVLRAGRRARDLILQILTFSRQARQEMKPLLVKAVVKEALKLLNASLPASIEIRENIRTHAMVMGDPIQIHQIMMNLCTNAGHAMGEDGGTLTVELEALSHAPDSPDLDPDLGDGPFVRLSVSDTGRGIPPEVLPSIFDPFFTTKEQGEGTGMGLAVVHGIVKALKGVIRVQSDPGKGSRFDIFLPAADAESRVEKTVETDTAGGIEQILYVDDEPPLVEIGREFLEGLGYRVECRTDPVEALDLFRKSPNRFDLVITDMTMPRLTGDRLVREMRRLRPDLPVLICTGFSTKLTDRAVKEMGIQGFLMKPIIPSDLGRLVRNILNNTTPEALD